MRRPAGTATSASGRPITSSADQPKISSDRGFQPVMRPASSTATQPSWAVSSTDRSSRQGRLEAGALHGQLVVLGAQLALGALDLARASALAIASAASSANITRRASAPASIGSSRVVAASTAPQMRPPTLTGAATPLR